MNRAMKNREGYRCTIEGCPKAKNRLFTADGLQMHLKDIHQLVFSNKEFSEVFKYGEFTEEEPMAKQKRIERLIHNITSWKAKVSR